LIYFRGKAQMRGKTTMAAAWLLLLGLIASSAAASDLRLLEAVKKHDHAAARALLAQGVEVNATQPDGATALHWAAYLDDLEMAGLLLGAGAGVNSSDDRAVTPLSLACANASAAMVEALLQAGADPNAVLLTGETPLMTAARTGSASVVSALLSRGVVVDTKEPARGQTALMWAVSEQHPPVVQLLLDRGADASARSNTGFTPILFAAREGDRESARLLLAAGVDVNDKGPDGASALLVATVRGHAAFALFLLDNGADPNTDAAGYTPLHWAAGSWETSLTGSSGISEGTLGGLQAADKLLLVKALLGHGADPNAPVVKNPPRFGFNLFRLRLAGATPFLLAALAGDATLMRVLVDAGADPTLMTKDRTSPLMAASGIGFVPGESRAAESSAVAAVKLALDLGGDVNASNDSGETALHGAAYRGADAIVQVLADHGAAVNARTVRGDTPLLIAEGKGVRQTGGLGSNVYASTAKLLRSLGAIDDAPAAAAPSR
jgi:ankyrin repeat protein